MCPYVHYEDLQITRVITYWYSRDTTVFLGVLSPPNVQENWRLETGLRVFAVQQTYVSLQNLVQFVSHDEGGSCGGNKCGGPVII